MTPSSFPGTNAVFKSPPDLEGSCMPIPAYMGQVHGGVFDGSLQVIVAWKPSPEDLQRLNEGGLIFLSTIGGLPPHYLDTNVPFK